MRRRPREGSSTVPERLRVFVASDWDAEPFAALHKWSEARRGYYDAHPEAWPHYLAVLAGFANARAKLMGRRPMYPGMDEGNRGSAPSPRSGRTREA